VGAIGDAGFDILVCEIGIMELVAAENDPADERGYARPSFDCQPLGLIGPVSGKGLYARYNMDRRWSGDIRGR